MFLYLQILEKFNQLKLMENSNHTQFEAIDNKLLIRELTVSDRVAF